MSSRRQHLASGSPRAGSSMVTEANKTVVRRLVDEVLNGGHLEVIHELYVPELVPAARRWIGPFRASFPDVDMEVVDLIAEGDKVVGRFTCSATHLGDLARSCPHRAPLRAGRRGRHLPPRRRQDRRQLVAGGLPVPPPAAGAGRRPRPWRRAVTTGEDLRHLRRCVALATEALEAGDEPFGSVLVAADGTVLAEDRNRVASLGDPTRHPEFELVRWAATNLAPAERAAATVY